MADKGSEERNTFLRSILNRGPNKRQIKPAENNSLLQLALGEDSEDSEEDEDFEVNDDDEEDEGSEEENDDSAEKEEEEEKSDDNKQEVEISDNEDIDEDDAGDDNEREMKTDASLTVGELIEAMKTKKKLQISQPSSVASSEISASSTKKVAILICGICLDDVSDEGDEIVECDNCGITVHEGCYGINDEDSDCGKSNETDSPTELWFCDACKLGLQPDCELCPNLGGIFKETDTGQWVHLLCALYTPDVAFVKPEQLQCVTLSELPHYKWGAKDCNLCEDERFCRTGVCIECDAGMCRTYFHVTCAQMYGLLSDVPEECDEDVADPLFAHCRLHADKRTAASRRRTWLAYQSRYKKFSDHRSQDDKERVKQCLENIRLEFQEKRRKSVTKYYTPTERIPRVLNTCPGACRQLLKKAQLLGYSTGQTQSVINVRRKWFVQPALTSEFVTYYHDRSARLKEMQERQEELESSNKRLQKEEQSLRGKYHELTEIIQLLAEDIKERRQESLNLHRFLCKLSSKELDKPSLLESKKPKQLTSQTPSKSIKLHMCNTCKTTENQHQLVQCDTCHYYYHLGCVDPPLTRMPKRSAKCLWQCSECDPSDDEDEMEVDPEDTTPISQGRQRRIIKEPSKFTPDKGEAKKRKLNKSKRKAQPVGSENGSPDDKNSSLINGEKEKSQELSSEPSKKRGRRPGRKVTEPAEKKKKLEDVRTECCVCKERGTNANLVRCDSCKQCYHFQCLDPPIKANPKTRGYQWFCTECDESEEESEEEGDEDKSRNSDKTENIITTKETKEKSSEKDTRIEKQDKENEDEENSSVASSVPKENEPKKNAS
ncbi:PHD finger protein 14-like [Acropora millepora]|uniref:PHD finger protein 14-like n=1 Tax=Acropora millepora TaxID=45264 RepID=UPI001CF54D62|nr:PHD finger protein 14-like [Acropora millepora]